jgi:omega-amidase
VFGAGGKLLAEYAKVHPFTFGREPEAFEGGDGVVTYAWGGLTVCPAVCYDLRFPELFRHGLMRGAEVFCLGANWPDARQAHWRALAMARAIENQAFVLAVNRVGRDPHLGVRRWHDRGRASGGDPGGTRG